MQQCSSGNTSPKNQTKQSNNYYKYQEPVTNTGASDYIDNKLIKKLIIAAGTCYAQKEFSSKIENTTGKVLFSSFANLLIEGKPITSDGVKNKVILVELKKNLKESGHENIANALDIEQFAECVLRRAK